jgi:hypothetical protein
MSEHFAGSLVVLDAVPASTGIAAAIFHCFHPCVRSRSLCRFKFSRDTPTVQREIILQRSDRLWETVQEKLPKIVGYSGNFMAAKAEAFS